MTLLYIIILALALSVDAFSVSLTVGLTSSNISTFYKLRYYFVIGIFHVIMMLLGWIVGETFIKFIGNYGNYISCVLLIYLGVKMLFDKDNDENVSLHCFKKLDKTIMFGFILSIDAIVAGFTLSTQTINIITNSSQVFNAIISSLIVGVVSSFAAWIGVKIGQKAGKLLGKYSMFLGGLILIILGLNSLINT